MVHALLHFDCTEMCVGSGCTQPSYNDKNPSSQCFCLYFLIRFSLPQIEPFVFVTSIKRTPLPGLLIDSSVSTLPTLSELSSYSAIVDTLEQNGV